MNQIFFKEQDKLTGRFIIVDEEAGTIWAYLTFPFGERIDKDCFLGSRLAIKGKLDLANYKAKGVPPPMIKEYSTRESHMPDLKESDFSVEWGENGRVVLKINRIPFLLFTDAESKGFCKAIAMDGMYGKPWCEDEFGEDASIRW